MTLLLLMHSKRIKFSCLPSHFTGSLQHDGARGARVFAGNVRSRSQPGVYQQYARCRHGRGEYLAGGALEHVHPVVFFDALRVKIREEAVVRNKAIYLALGVLSDGTRDILGLWI